MSVDAWDGCSRRPTQPMPPPQQGAGADSDRTHPWPLLSQAVLRAAWRPQWAAGGASSSSTTVSQSAPGIGCRTYPAPSFIHALVLPTSTCTDGRTGRTIYEWEQALEDVSLYIPPPPGYVRTWVDRTVGRCMYPCTYFPGPIASIHTSHRPPRPLTPHP